MCTFRLSHVFSALSASYTVRWVSMHKSKKTEPEVATEKSKSSMRMNYLRKPDYYMALAFLSAQRSKDPRTQVGACIVNNDGRIVGVGYNGLPNGVDDGQGNKDLWARKEKHTYVCHAELNAIVNKYTADIRGCTMYVCLFPCNNCAKVIVQSGIKHVVYYSDKKKDRLDSLNSKKLLEKANVTLEQYPRRDDPFVIDFNSIETEPEGTE